jgi:hypothetical protein
VGAGGFRCICCKRSVTVSAPVIVEGACAMWELNPVTLRQIWQLEWLTRQEIESKRCPSTAALRRAVFGGFVAMCQ